MMSRRVLVIIVSALLFGCVSTRETYGQTANQSGGPSQAISGAGALPSAISHPSFLEEAIKPEKLSASLEIMFLLTVLTLVPAILVMTTSFTRIVVVLALLRQAMGTQQLPH